MKNTTSEMELTGHQTTFSLLLITRKTSRTMQIDKLKYKQDEIEDLDEELRY